MYYSVKNSKLVEISSMATNHIKNALRKIHAGTHSYYSKESPMQLGLLMELDARNNKMLDYYRERAIHLQTRCDHAVARIVRLQKRVETTEAKIWSLGTPPTLESRSVAPRTLDSMRGLALELAKRYGAVTADTLRLEIGKRWYTQNIPSNMHALAHVFRDKAFRKIGFVKSKIRSNHGRFISVWGAAANL